MKRKQQPGKKRALKTLLRKRKKRLLKKAAK